MKLYVAEVLAVNCESPKVLALTAQVTDRVPGCMPCAARQEGGIKGHVAVSDCLLKSEVWLRQ